jgi:hypothetical protein
VIAAVVLLLPTPALAGGEVNLFFGQRDIDDDILEELCVDSPQQIGIELTFGHQWPVAIAIDYFQSEDDGDYYTYKLDAEIQELDVGVRYLFRKDKTVVPFVGGGFAHVKGELSARGLGSVDDDTMGFWIQAGVNFRIGKFFNLGADLRHVSSEVGFDDVDVEVGGMSYGVLVGFRWGGS